MATEKEEVILDFKIEDNDIISQLERTKKVIIGLKDEQKKLTKAYKDGDVTLDEYAQDAVRLETQLKKVTATHNENTRAVAGTKNVLTELTKSNKALADQLGKTQGNVTNITNKFTTFSKDTKTAVQQVNVAGVSVGDLSTKLASFANPATAAVAVVGLLGAAYAKSATGAKDLEFASLQLSSATQIAADSFGKLFDKAGEGKGFFSTLVAGLLFQISPTLAAMADIQAEAERTLKSLEIARAFAAGFGKEDERRAEIQRRIRDDQTKTLEERYAAAAKIDPILENSAQRTIAVIQAQINGIIESTASYEKNIEAQLKVAQLQGEIKDKEEEITGKLTENVTARRAILSLLQEQEAIQKRLAELDALPADRGVLGKIDLSEAKPNLKDSNKSEAQLAEQERTKEIIEGTAQFEIDNKIYLNSALETLEDQRVKQSIAQKEQEVKTRNALDQAAFNAAESIFGSLSQLAKDGSEEQKALALTGIAVDTAAALAGGISSSQDIPYPGNLVAMASTIATILANIAQAKSIAGFAEGGYTGPGYGRPDSSGFKPAGIVHENEYVAPKWIVNSSAGSYHVNALESMRLRGYADGGLVTSSATQDTNTAVAQMNALKNLPAPVLSIVEYEKKAKRVRIKEDLSRLKR